MPITFNHSNIGVQYSTGSNYIIETVKSDLYRRNEIVDTIVRDNIQTAPVTPIISIQEGSNVYAVESYTYSGSANTRDYTRVFTKSTTCDILIVGGGGGGGQQNAGGGGAGGLVLVQNLQANGSFTINVGKGGNGANGAINVGGNGSVGNNSTFIKSDNSIIITANGGGGGGGGGASQPITATNGGSGGGGGWSSANGTQTQKSQSQIGVISPAIINQFGENGGHGGGDGNSYPGGGGGGAGGVGATSASNTTGQNGGPGIDRVGAFVFSQTFLSSVGDNGWFAGGGGSGGDGASEGYGNGGSSLFGGGGNGDGIGRGINGINGTGGGGGSIRDPSSTLGGNGGSGIVIIRYLLGTIPSNNLLTAEPIFLSPTITSNLSIFTHSGGAEAQTTHTITIGQNTICDILIVGGGGAGGGRQGGGGGAGGVMFLENQQLAPGNYTIKVGKGGGAEFQGAPENGKDSELGTFIAYGGSGAGGFSIAKSDFNITTNRFGSGGGAMGWNNDGGYDGWHNANERINQTNPSVQGGSSYKGGRGWQDISGEPSSFISALVGGGGGGAGGLGEDATPNNNTNYTGKAGNGGVGLNYGAVFGTRVGANGWFGGGGGGAGYSSSTDIAGTGGTGGGGSGNTGSPGIAGTNGTGGGGGGGGFPNTVGGIGGSGIVIVRIRTLNVITPVTEGFYKKMDFKFTPNYPEIAADKTTNIVAWYKFDEMSVNEGYLDSNPSNIKHNLIKPSGSTPIFSSTINISGTSAGEQGTVSHLQFPTSLTDQLYTINNTNGITFSLWYNYSNNTPVWGSFFEFSQNSTDSGTNNRFGLCRLNLENKVELFMKSPTDVFNNFSFGTNTLDNNWHHLSWSISSSGQWTVYLDGVNQNTTQNKKIANNTYNTSHIFWHVYNGNTTQVFGYIDDFRIYNYVLSAAEIATLYNINSVPKTDTYTLNFPVPTIADINNNSNIVLRGAYDIALSTSNALIIPKAGQYIPQPTTFTNYSIERMYPPVRNFTAATTTLSGQTYGNGTYVVSYSSTYGSSIDPWNCFNTANPGGAWPNNRYTAGTFNSTSFIVAGYLGDWLKIQLPVAIKLTRFEFLMRTDTQGIRERSPKNFKIYGSNDNITWVELVNKTDAVYDTSFRYIQLTQDITTAYTYYGLVVNKLLGSTADTLNFDEWYIYGQEVLPSSLSLRYNLLNPTQDPIGAQWTYNTSNINVYHMGSVGIGTTSPEYQLDVSGSLNAKTLMYNGSSVNSLGLSVGMIAQVQHLTYTKMEVKDNTGWDAINEDLTSGFVIKITPKSSLSKMLVNLIVFIGMSTSVDNAWWGIKLYRKIGTGSWTEITGCNGTETGSAAATAGTPVWISNNTGMVTYNSSITNASGTYLDSPNTTATVYYTAYWNQRLGDNPSTTGQMFLNRASSQDDAYRPAPSSSWTVEEIWYG